MYYTHLNIEVHGTISESQDFGYVLLGISNFFRKVMNNAIVLGVIFLMGPLLYVILYAIFLIINYRLRKITGNLEIFIKDATAYKEVRKQYDDLAPLVKKLKELRGDKVLSLGKVSKLMKLLNPLIKQAGKFLRKLIILESALKRSLDKLDTFPGHTQLGNFTLVTEKEVWENRINAYEYRL